MQSTGTVTDAAAGASKRRHPSISYVQPGERSARAALISAIEHLSGRPKVEAVYHRLKDEGFDARTFFSRALELADIRYTIRHGDEASIPRSGPIVFVANHPFGVVDGLMLCDIASRLRGDFRILIHALLCRDEDLAPFFLPIDFRDSREARGTNIQSKRAALKTLAEGGAIIVFPGGGISTRRKAGFGDLADLPWTTFTAKLVLQSQATVVPLFFHGCNSRLFHLASGVSDALRASLLLHEARNKMGEHFEISLGAPIAYDQIEHFDRRGLTQHLHELTWALGS